MNEQALSKIESTLLKIESILSESDIVWPRYGRETVEELAKKILESIVDKE